MANSKPGSRTMSYGLPQSANCSAPPVNHCSSATELTIGPRIGADAADIVHTGGERPVLPGEGLGQSTGHAVLFEHEHPLAAARQRSGRGEPADARTDNDGVPHERCLRLKSVALARVLLSLLPDYRASAASSRRISSISCEYQRHARRIDLEVACQPHRAPRALQRRAGEAPVGRRFALRLEHAFVHQRDDQLDIAAQAAAEFVDVEADVLVDDQLKRVGHGCTSLKAGRGSKSNALASVR